MFPKLFEPGAIGKLWLKNRLIRAAIMTSYADMNGCVTDRVVRHYRESARGGAGIVIVESAYIDDKASKSGKCMIGASRDEHKPGLQWLASTIRASGAIACLQIEHCGRQKGTGTPPVKAPSCIPNKGFYSVGGPPPEELTFEEILEIVEAFGKAAFRAKQVGFDAVEVQGSHGYLITNFLSPHTNKRTDCYGGSLKNRITFLLEVIDSIRRKVGPDYPLSIRLSGTDYAEDEPITIEETIEVAKVLEIEGTGTHWEGGLFNTVKDYNVTYRYANGVEMTCTSGNPSIKFIGTEGWVCNKGWRGKVEASSKEILDSEIGTDEIHLYTNPAAKASCR